MNRRGGFTLLELLVTLALVAVLAAVVLRGAFGAGESGVLQSAQAEAANVIAVARTRAAASGESARVLVNFDATRGGESLGFLRQMVVQTADEGGWRTRMAIYLPRGAYVVPGNFATLPAGLFSSEHWLRGDGTTLLRSTVLRADGMVTEAVEGEAAQRWASFSISANGTTAQSGDLILAEGTQRVAGAISGGESPVELTNPDRVRGVSLSVYGVTALVNDRASF